MALYMQWRNPLAFQRTASASDIDDVRWTISMDNPATLPMIEFKVPTCSYRMGVQAMGLYANIVINQLNKNFRLWYALVDSIPRKSDGIGPIHSPMVALTIHTVPILWLFADWFSNCLDIVQMDLEEIWTP
jgi:hypothetical protein